MTRRQRWWQYDLLHIIITDRTWLNPAQYDKDKYIYIYIYIYIKSYIEINVVNKELANQNTQGNSMHVSPHMYVTYIQGIYIYIYTCNINRYASKIRRKFSSTPPARKSSAGYLYSLRHLLVLRHLHSWRHLLDYTHTYTSVVVTLTHCIAVNLYT